MDIAVPFEEYACSILSHSGDLLNWCILSIKPKKSRRLSIMKNKAVSILFSVADQTIPVVFEEPVKSLGRGYDVLLTYMKAV